MHFALLNGVRNHPDRPDPLAEVYADYISDAVLAEELGFTNTWYGEHHFRPCQWTGSPMLVATAVAARTERIRIGTSVALLPFHDPRRLAEDAATFTTKPVQDPLPVLVGRNGAPEPSAGGRTGVPPDRPVQRRLGRRSERRRP